MPESTVTLLENATAFINESIRNARRAKRESRHWSFAILHLIQGLELTMKHVLQLQHPLFIYDNIDKPKNTINLMLCLDRLKNIADIQIDEKEERAVRRASRQRNKIVHHEYDLKPDYYRAVFVDLFEFVHYFHAKHLPGELHDRIDPKLWRAEAELLAQFDNELVTYRGKIVHNSGPLDIVTSQRYTTLRKLTDEGYEYFTREKYLGEHGSTCEDCDVKDGELHGFYCDIERCPCCGGQLLGCDCGAEYWIPTRGKGLP